MRACRRAGGLLIATDEGGEAHAHRHVIALRRHTPQRRRINLCACVGEVHVWRTWCGVRVVRGVRGVRGVRVGGVPGVCGVRRVCGGRGRFRPGAGGKRGPELAK